MVGQMGKSASGLVPSFASRAKLVDMGVKSVEAATAFQVERAQVALDAPHDAFTAWVYIGKMGRAYCDRT